MLLVKLVKTNRNFQLLQPLHSCSTYSLVSTRECDDYCRIARYHVPALAQDLYEKIAHIRRNGNSLGEFVLVGFSVGAHVAGQTAKLLKSNTEYTVDRIYGKMTEGLT